MGGSSGLISPQAGMLTSQQSQVSKPDLQGEIPLMKPIVSFAQGQQFHSITEAEEFNSPKSTKMNFNKDSAKKVANPQ
jgi:hypothetical protein